MTCPVCREDNVSEALFCSRCTSPLSVVRLGDLDPEDHRAYLAALFDVLGDVTGERVAPLDPELDALWRRYLSAFWLRPETALVCFAEARAVRDMAATRVGPWLDLGCGDGIHAALMADWEFSDTFDAFQSLDLGAPDIYHHWDASRFKVEVRHRGAPVEYGVDIKETAIARSTALDVFTEVLRADVVTLPVADASVGTIFTNMLRDLDDTLDAALSECHRVLADDGVMFISAMTPEYRKHLYFAPKAEAAADRLEAERWLRLDRGRSVFCRQQLSLTEWQARLGTHGLRVADSRPLFGAAATRFWDVGLRPFSPELVTLTDGWRATGSLAMLKPVVTNLLARVLAPLAATVGKEGECSHLLTVTKTGASWPRSGGSEPRP